MIGNNLIEICDFLVIGITVENDHDLIDFVFSNFPLQS